ncbi:hypothetical protein [Dysgonomonas reticulitermitis]
MLSSFLFSCDKDDYKVETLTVAAHKAEYHLPFGDAILMGYAVTDSENREYVIDYIEGFEDKYEEGYIFVIKVKVVEKNKNKKPVEDLFGNDYYLIEIISKEKE